MPTATVPAAMPPLRLTDVRLVREGRAILSSHESDRLVSRPTMLDAAETAVALAAS